MSGASGAGAFGSRLGRSLRRFLSARWIGRRPYLAILATQQAVLARKLFGVITRFSPDVLDVWALDHLGGKKTRAFSLLLRVEVQKQMIGERLFPAISKHQPELAGKITGQAIRAR